MGAHPPVGSYPGLAGTKWANMRDSDSLIVSRDRSWPTLDGGPLVGAEEGYTMLKQVASAVPPHDERYFVLVGTETPIPESWELRTNWTLEDRPLVEIKAAAENVEAEKAASLIRMEKAIMEHHMAIAVIANVVFASQQPPPRFRALIDRIRAEAVKLFLNRDRLNEVVTQLNAGQKPNLDDGYQVP